MFEESELEIMEFRSDLELFYQCGYGNYHFYCLPFCSPSAHSGGERLNYEISAGLLQDFVEVMDDVRLRVNITKYGLVCT